MKLKTYKDLVKTPLAREDAEPEEILLELAVKFGDKASVLDICRALTLIHENYHTSSDMTEDLAFETMHARQVGHNSLSNLVKAWMMHTHQVVPTLVPSQSVQTAPMTPPQPFQVVSDLPNLAYPSDTILKNLFKLLFETSEWDKIATSERLKKHVEKLCSKARSSMKVHLKVKGEEWRTIPDRKSEQLFEIWAEMLDKIAEKKRKIQERGKSNG